MIAKSLYRSQWFKLARSYTEQQGGHWRILSAKHGLLHPGNIIAPYDRHIQSMHKAARKRWADQILLDLHDLLEPNQVVTMLAGKLYREHLVLPLERAGHTVEIPMKGLSIGCQLQWLKANT